jgi:hypothetical protein
VNEGLVLKTEATRFQPRPRISVRPIRRGNQISDTSRIRIEPGRLGKNLPRSFGQEQQRYYAREQRELAQIARQKEQARDQASAEADYLLHQHHRYADSVALLQIAIALAAVAALTRVRLIWFGFDDSWAGWRPSFS